jgi:diadenosine tetraphosphatase ApaH/serine/threonine PP2A family protein phosphatase
LRYFIFSDIHANLEALEAVLAWGGEADVGFYLCLGDIVGYGADPNACVEIIKRLDSCACIKGNHDAAVIDVRERSFFHEVALEGVQYSEEKLSATNREFIENLPYVYASDGLFIGVHASPFNPATWEYVLDQGGAKRAFGAMEHQVAFIGHSHTPVIFNDDGKAERFLPGDKVTIRENTRYIVNVGSVGQPRDGNPDASCVVFDDETLTVELVRVNYDRQKAAEKIIKAGLPPVLAERIIVGY